MASSNSDTRVPESAEDMQTESGFNFDSDDSDDGPAGPIPYEDEHPNKYVPWGLKLYSPEIIKAWTMVHNYTLVANSVDMMPYLSKLPKEVLDQPTHDGQTLLFMAACRGMSHVVECLLKSGASPNKGEDYFDMSPLAVAVKNCHVECVQKLLEFVDVNEKDKSGFTVLFHIASCGLEKEGREFLYCFHKEENMIRQTKSKIVLEMLLDKGADVNCTSSVGLTPLLIAASNDNGTAVGILLDRGADPMATYRDSLSRLYPLPVTALDRAAESGSLESLRVLLERCSSIKALMSRDTAIRLAVMRGHLDCVKCFIDAGFDADVGVKLPKYELLQYKKSCDAYPLLASLCDANLEIAQYLLSKGASPLLKGLAVHPPYNRCPLYQAFFIDDTLLKTFLEHCADIEGIRSSGCGVQFPVQDINVWKQSVSRFGLILQAGLCLDMESVQLATSQCDVVKTFEEVAKMWWTYTGNYSQPRAVHLAEILGHFADTPRSLAELCRIVVRQRIGFPRLAKASKSAHLLPVPRHLQDYIMHV